LELIEDLDEVMNGPRGASGGEPLSSPSRNYALSQGAPDDRPKIDADRKP
jgi:hypothetical protein